MEIKIGTNGEENKITLSIIIINWNSANYLYKCLKAIMNSTTKKSYEIIVVDNGSFDNTIAITSKFPKVRFYQLQRNIGFAGANNFGFKKSKGDVLLFLNPDTEIETNTIDILTDLLLKHHEAAIAGCRLINQDGSVQLSSVLGYPSIVNEILDCGFLMKKFHWLKIWDNHVLFIQKDIIREVAAVSGACMAVKRDDFSRINGFNEEYFMYSEDIDICYKVQKYNKKVLFTNTSKVLHYGGGSSKLHPVNAFSTKMIFESKYIFIKNNYGKVKSLIYRINLFFVILLRMLILFLLFPVLILINRHILFRAIKKWYIIGAWLLKGCKN